MLLSTHKIQYNTAKINIKVRMKYVPWQTVVAQANCCILSVELTMLVEGQEGHSLAAITGSGLVY